MRGVPGSELLRAPVFRTYFLGRTISTFGSAFGTLAITFGVLQSGGGPAQLGVVLGASALPALLLMLFGGVAGDRLERRSILISTDLVMASVQAGAAALFLVDRFDVVALAALQLLRGGANAFFNPASTGMLPSVVDRDDLQSANALLGISRNLSSIVAPAVAGVVIAVTSPGVALVVDAASFAASAALLTRLPRSRGRVQAGMSILGDVRVGWREFSSRPWVWQMVLSFSVYQATVLPTILLVGPTISQSDGSGASGWAVVLSCRAVGSVLAGFLMLRWRAQRPLLSASLLILLDVPFLATLALGLPVAAVAATSVISAVGLIGSDNLWESTLQRRIPSESISRVSSYDWLGSLAMNPAGNVLVGVLVVAAGAHEVVTIVIVVHVLTHLLLVASPAIREREPAAAAGT